MRYENDLLCKGIFELTFNPKYTNNDLKLLASQADVNKELIIIDLCTEVRKCYDTLNEIDDRIGTIVSNETFSESNIPHILDSVFGIINDVFGEEDPK